ncbi:GntR family transcriptional regulator, partial [Frankia sp. Ag45/Mut15]
MSAFPPTRTRTARTVTPRPPAARAAHPGGARSTSPAAAPPPAAATSAPPAPATATTTTTARGLAPGVLAASLRAAGVPAQATGSANRVGRHVRVPKTAELVAAHLRRQIVRGELHEGDALPPEAVLMEQFGVSRPTLREAFRVLESEALISVRRGAHGGARVHTPGGDVAARYTALVLEHQHTTLADIHTAHTHLETTTIRLLATTITDTHLTTLTHHLTTTTHLLDTPNPDPTTLHTHHLHFHTLLLTPPPDTTPTNHTLTTLTHMLRHILDATTHDTEPPTLDTLHHHHTTHHHLLTHLTNHDPDAAAHHWHHHLTHQSHIHITEPTTRRRIGIGEMSYKKKIG